MVCWFDLKTRLSPVGQETTVNSAFNKSLEELRNPNRVESGTLGGWILAYQREGKEKQEFKMQLTEFCKALESPPTT